VECCIPRCAALEEKATGGGKQQAAESEDRKSEKTPKTRGPQTDRASGRGGDAKPPVTGGLLDDQRELSYLKADARQLGLGMGGKSRPRKKTERRGQVSVKEDLPQEKHRGR